jgi:hypothetical protein
MKNLKKKIATQCWAGFQPTSWHCWPRPAVKSAHGTGVVRRARSPRAARAWWRTHRWPGDGRSSMRCCRRALGGFQDDGGQGEETDVSL